MTIAVGIVEAIVLIVLFGWWMLLRSDANWIRQEQEACYACVTGASVTSFTPNRAKFCKRHLAHWELIKSLEEQERDINEWMEIERDIEP